MSDKTPAEDRAEKFNVALAEAQQRYADAHTNTRLVIAEDIAAIDTIHSHAVGLAAQITMLAPDTRDRSVALTALEDVMIRANRAIYLNGVKK